MHSSARGARSLFGIIVAFALLGSVLAVPTIVRAAADSEPVVAAAEDAELARLADKAKDDFRARIYPPALGVLTVVEREPTQTIRAYVLRSFESAIDALVAEAHRSPQAARAVEVALQRLVASGSTFRTDAIFSEIIERETGAGQAGARPAAAIRNSVALEELPAALAPLIDLPVMFREKALPAYRRAAELDPDEPWTWIAIAGMGEATRLAGPYKVLPQTVMTGKAAEVAEVESAIDKGQAAALASREDDAVIAALHARARVRLTQGRADEAERALLDAVMVAEEQARVEPGFQANLALCLNLLGEFYARQGDHGRAASSYRRALEIRQRLATAAPDDEAKQIDLAASHVRLAKLAGETGNRTEAKEHWNEADRIYNAVNSLRRFRPRFLDVALSSSAFLEEAFLLAGILTLVGGFVLLARYRRAVDRWMKAAARASRPPAASRPETSPATIAGEGSFAPRSPGIAGGTHRGATFVYVVAGCAFGAAVAPALASWLSGFWIAAGAAVSVLALLWGILTLVGGFVLAQYRRMKAAARASRRPATSAAMATAAAAGGRELAICSLKAIARTPLHARHP